MEQVVGIGGVFFKARDPKALAAWYREHLGVPVEPEQTYGKELQLDVEFGYQFTDNVSFVVGASNLLDEYPDLSSPDINFFGNLPYDILSPIGVNGRYVYTRIGLTL